ncbi:hypothetical protein W02_27550 [Nitrospira sp. KM1]|nr:hypothetical protein W02_27550 [Nitrospira sp. KM1]
MLRHRKRLVTPPPLPKVDMPSVSPSNGTHDRTKGGHSTNNGQESKSDHQKDSCSNIVGNDVVHAAASLLI